VRKFFPRVKIVGHPCTLEDQRAHCDVDERRPLRPPLVRNRNIVDACTILTAAPRSTAEELRSGTWSTVRYARAHMVPDIILKP
jgi:hypothetical protein